MNGVCKSISVVLASCLLGACERVVDITLPEAPERLVVEGRVERVRGVASGRQVVVLSMTTPFFSNSGAPPARGAEVTIRDAAGRTTVLRESSAQPGRYVTDSLVATVGERYTLRIRWRGDDYEAIDSLAAVAPIDSMYFDAPSAGGVGPGSGTVSGGLRATIDMRDPVNVANYYLWDMYIDGRQIAASDTNVRMRAIDSDQFYDGRRLRGLQPHDAYPVRSGQTVLVRQQSISAQMYRYYRALNDQMENDGSPFAVPAASLRGNVANLTRPLEGASGYFLATNVSERTLRVP